MLADQPHQRKLVEARGPDWAVVMLDRELGCKLKTLRSAFLRASDAVPQLREMRRVGESQSVRFMRAERSWEPRDLIDSRTLADHKREARPFLLDPSVPIPESRWLPVEYPYMHRLEGATFFSAFLPGEDVKIVTWEIPDMYLDMLLQRFE